MFAGRKEEDKFQQNVDVNFKLEEFNYLHNAMNSLYEKLITKKPIKIVLIKIVAKFYFETFFSVF